MQTHENEVIHTPISGRLKVRGVLMGGSLSSHVANHALNYSQSVESLDQAKQA